MDTNPVETPSAVNNVKLKKGRRRRKGKMKANNGHAVQSMDQKDKNVDDFESGRNGMVAKDCSQDNLLAADSAPKLSREHSKTDMVSTTNPLEMSTKSEKSRRKRAKKKAKRKHGPQSMDHTDIISNLSLADASDGHADGKMNNKTGVSQESGHTMGKGSEKSCSRPLANLAQKDGELVELCLNNHNASSPSLFNVSSYDICPQPSRERIESTHPLETSAKCEKKRRKREKKKAKRKHGPQNMDHIDIISNLSLADASDGHDDGKINNKTGVSQKSGHSMGKGSEISCARPLANLAQKDGKLVKLCINNHTASLPGLFNVSSYDICPQLSRERVESSLGIWNKEVTEHRSSEVINEAQNYVFADPYQIPGRRKIICSRRKLLILDVNGLLADIVRPPPQDRKANANISGRAIFKRPFCYDFLKFCFERFDVGIWSSRSKYIIDKVVDYLLGDLKHKLLFCWDMFYCTETRFRTLENRYKPMVLKELRKLWEKHDPNLPWEKGDYDESNTLLLDDSPYKALLNPMHTGVFPCSYSYRNTRDNSLGPGGDLRVYLEGLVTAESVQDYIAEHPFGQGVINETNPYWSFYSGVLRSLFIQSDKSGVTLDKEGDC